MENSKKFPRKEEKTASSQLNDSNHIERNIMRFKVILVGDAAVGKTSILHRFVHNRFKIDYNCTIGVDYSIKSLALSNNMTVDLQLWDTCGQERFKTLTRQYYRDANGNNHILIKDVLLFLI